MICILAGSTLRLSKICWAGSAWLFLSAPTCELSPNGILLGLLPGKHAEDGIASWPKCLVNHTADQSILFICLKFSLSQMFDTQGIVLFWGPNWRRRFWTQNYFCCCQSAPGTMDWCSPYNSGIAYNHSTPHTSLRLVCQSSGVAGWVSGNADASWCCRVRCIKESPFILNPSPIRDYSQGLESYLFYLCINQIYTPLFQGWT